MSVTTLGWDEYLYPTNISLLPVILVTSGIAIGGTSGLLILTTLSFVRRRKPRNRAVVTTFSAAMLNLIALLGFCIVQIALVSERISDRGYDVFGPAGWFRPWSTKDLRQARVFLEEMMIILGDLVVISRARAMYPDRRWISVILIALWILCVGWGVAFYALLSIGIDKPQAQSSLIAYSCVFAGLSATANFMATGLIALRLWSYRRFLRKELGLRQPRYTRVQKALVTIVETGCVYRFAQVALFNIGIIAAYGTRKLSTGVAKAMPLVHQVFFLISGLYPVAVFILLSIQSQREDRFSFIDLANSIR